MQFSWLFPQRVPLFRCTAHFPTSQRRGDSRSGRSGRSQRSCRSQQLSEAVVETLIRTDVNPGLHKPVTMGMWYVVSMWGGDGWGSNVMFDPNTLVPPQNKCYTRT